MDYQNKVILAPMVRLGTLPLRLLSLDYGADIVYTEELIDYKILQSKRVENPILGTVDFVWTDGTIVYRTCPREKGRLVLQIGTADPERAVRAAKLVEKDVSAIDVNMGCPKEFSVKGGMGAALLKEPEKAKEILTALVEALSVPVTCKIRILDTVEETMEFVRAVESTGIKALGLHGRRKEERPRHSNHNDIIKLVAESAKIPVIANGGSMEIISYEDISKFQADTGATAVMIARRAQWNPSIFRKEGMLPSDDVILEYLKYAIDYDSHEMNLKYCLQQLLHDRLDTPLGKALLSTTNIREMCALWDMESYYLGVIAKRKGREAELRMNTGQSSAFKRRKLEDGSEVVEMPFKYHRRNYPDTTGPKMILYVWTRKNNLPNAEYTTTQNSNDRLFRTVVDVNGEKFTSTWWEKSKKAAEQAAAAVCLSYMDMDDGRKASSSVSIGKSDHKDEVGLSQKENGLGEINALNDQKDHPRMEKGGDGAEDVPIFTGPSESCPRIHDGLLDGESNDDPREESIAVKDNGSCDSNTAVISIDTNRNEDGFEQGKEQNALR